MRKVTNTLSGFVLGPMAMLVGGGIFLVSVLAVLSGKGENVVLGLLGLAIGVVIFQVGHYMFFT